MSELDQFGQGVARAMGDSVPPEVRRRVRARVMAIAPRRRGWHWRVWMPLAGLLAVAAALVVWQRSHSLEASTPRGALAEGDWLTAPSESDLQIVFKDRGLATLSEKTRVRVAKLSRASVELALESGQVAVDVKPKSGTTWSVVAGPFRVEVLGTAFETSWSPERDELEVLVRRGVVRVTGASISQHGVELRAGDTLKANAHRGETMLGHEPAGAAEPRATEAVAPDMSRPSPSASAALSEHSLPPGVPEPAASAERQPPSSDAFRELARSGKHGEALALADELGFESLANSLGAADLELLANAARYQKQSSKARLALLALRRRFPGSSQAGTATFLLGRLAAEQSADYSGAAKWFLTYSKEYPTSPLVAEALGRRVQLLALAGEEESARGAAERYLERYPNGAYASVATGVLAGRKLKSGP